MTEKLSASITLAATGQRISCSAGSRCALECLEKKNITVAYQCREGYCGACRATLVSGTVSYNEEPLAFVREGEILLCCCKPQGDITIDI